MQGNPKRVRRALSRRRLTVSTCPWATASGSTLFLAPFANGECYSRNPHRAHHDGSV
jgi:hypothetical protein